MTIARAAVRQLVVIRLSGVLAIFSVYHAEELQRQPPAAETRPEQRFPYFAGLPKRLRDFGVSRRTRRRRIGSGSRRA